MRKLHILKALIGLFYFISWMAAVGFTLVVPMLLFGYESVPVTIKGARILVDNWPARLLLISVYFAMLIFLYAVYLLRQNVALFLKRELFCDKVILNFDRIGKCLVASALLTSVPFFVFNMLRHNNVGLEISSGSDSLLISLVFGVFFMVLAQVFRIAKNLKEENDLTL